jgi:glycosyltransferase involved in cell wall biosynthesis
MENEKYRVKISVIIPVFNVEKYLRRCVDSVLAQTFRDFEIILVDDCSPDASPAICDEYAGKNTATTTGSGGGGGVKVMHNPQNKGLSQARKVGLDAAVGDYILFVDSDDWIESNMLELLYNKATDDDLDMVYCGFYNNTDKKQDEFDFDYIDDKFKIIKGIVCCIHFHWIIWNKLVKRDIYNKIFFTTASYGEDIQISFQIMHYIEKFGYIKKSLYHYYYNINSFSNDNSRYFQRILGIYEITLWIVNFCYNNYRSRFSVFEPELSAHINSIKLQFVLEKSIRDTSKLHELYPVSKKRIFNIAWREPVYNKIILFIAVNNFAWLSYLSVDFINMVKKIYRLVIPQNIRSIIMRMRKNDF